MLTHVVLFKLKDRRPESIAEAKSRLDSLASGIETLRSIEIGTDIVRSGRSYDIVLITRFDDLDGYQIYREHPIHLPVLAYFHDAAESTVAVDFESEG